MIFRENSGKNFTNISNKLLQNPNISYKARGIATYLLSKHEDWETSIEDLKNNSPKEGRDSVRTALQELESEGFAGRNKVRDVDSGEFKGERWFVSDNKDWISRIKGRPSVPVVLYNGRYRVYNDGKLESPAADSPASGFSDAGLSGLREIQHNKEKNKQNKESKKRKKEQTSSSSTQKATNVFLEKDSHESRAVEWWVNQLVENKFLPTSVTKKGGVTQKMRDQWKEVLNKIHRLDGYSYKEIGLVLKWLIDTKDTVDQYGKPDYGNFWFSMSKFWSLNKLRKKTRDGDKTIFDSMFDMAESYNKKPKKQLDNFKRG